MSPIKKRARIRGESENEVVVLDTTSTIQNVVANLLDDIDKFNGDQRGVRQLKSNMLQLKAIQRQLYTKLNTQKVILEQAAVVGEKRVRAEAARQYEKSHLETEIRECKSYQTACLTKIACDEIGNESLNADEAILRFLNNANVRNPQEKEKILSSLHQQLESRGILENQLKIKQQELTTLMRRLQGKRDFLNLLPAQLQAIERASQPLVKFMAKSVGNNASFNQKMTGKERLLRLESAQALKTPLYTLFTLLQHYTDQMDFSNADEPSLHSKITIKVVAKKGPTPQQVTLQLPVPDYSTSTAITNSTKRVSIIFRYFSQVSLVTATVTGCASTLNQDVLLDELFPGDTTSAAEQMLSSKVAMMLPTNVGETNNCSPVSKNVSDNIPISITGTSYQWCSVLAGLYQVPNATTAIEDETEDHRTVLVHSTRVVMNELLRRVRANALLKHCLQSLRKNQIPVPPIIEQGGGDNATLYDWKVVLFAPIQETSSTVIGNGTNLLVSNTPSKRNTMAPDNIYQLVLQKGSEKIDATVQLHLSRYPAIPPKWTFIVEHSNENIENDDHHLFYNDRIAHIERCINVEILRRAKDDKSESFCEWILIHQIREIMNLWDESVELSTAEHNGSRTVRGRDHIIVRG